MQRGLTLGLLYVALSILATVGKGSDSHESSAEDSSESEDYDTTETGDKKTGAQHKFWIPTYQGTNPLNRRKIAITSSEIEKYDKTIDESLSGVYRNKTKHTKSNKTEDALSMPIIWSGEDENINNTRKYDISVDTSGITLESSSESFVNENAENVSNDSLLSFSSKKSKLNKGKTLKSTKESKAENRRQIKEDQTRGRKTKKKYVEKEITSRFFNELGKANSNDTEINANYYKKAVKSATENTKRKLGYNKQKIHQTSHKNSLKPEIIAVNIDSKSLETQNRQDEIEFKTSHKQYERPNTSQILKSPLGNLKSNRTTLKSNQDSSFQYSLEDKSKDIKEKTEDSFTEFCDYSAWSDVLSRNRTQRKAKQRKPKTKPISSSYIESREVGTSLGEDIKGKPEKLRQKEPKTSRQKKRAREIRKKQSKRNKGDKQDYYDQEDYPEKKLRMRTKGEKQYAIKEVKGYLQEMDKRYGGRPGRENYKTRNERRDREFNGREQRKGRDRRRNKWDDGDNDRDTRWSQRDYDDERRGNRDDEWNRRSGRGGGRERGFDRGGRQRGEYGDRRGRRDDYRGRSSGRGGFRSRGRERDDYRGSGGRRDSYRSRGSGRDGRGYSSRGRGRDNGRGGDYGRGIRRGRDDGRGSGRGREDRRGSGRD